MSVDYNEEPPPYLTAPEVFLCYLIEVRFVLFFFVSIVSG